MFAKNEKTDTSKEDAKNEEDNNKEIKFRQLFQNYKEMTEAGISYTNTHIEDVIFVDIRLLPCGG